MTVLSSNLAHCIAMHSMHRKLLVGISEKGVQSIVRGPEHSTGKGLFHGRDYTVGAVVCRRPLQPILQASPFQRPVHMGFDRPIGSHVRPAVVGSCSCATVDRAVRSSGCRCDGGRRSGCPGMAGPGGPGEFSHRPLRVPSRPGRVGAPDGGLDGCRHGADRDGREPDQRRGTCFRGARGERCRCGRYRRDHGDACGPTHDHRAPAEGRLPLQGRRERGQRDDRRCGGARRRSSRYGFRFGRVHVCRYRRRNLPHGCRAVVNHCWRRPGGLFR